MKSQNTSENLKVKKQQKSQIPSQKDGARPMPNIDVGSQLKLRCSQLRLRTIIPRDCGLPFFLHFHSIGTMKSIAAVTALSALAQESRLSVFRLLVQHEPNGLTPGVIGEQLALPAPTLSFHLKTLAQAGLVSAVQEGRFVRYRADMQVFHALTAFLTEDCCQGNLTQCDPKGKTS